MKQITLTLICLLVALRLDAAMVRVAGVIDGRTITIEREGARADVRLAGVSITDELRARELLRWTIGSAWVMLETSSNGEVLVYRSPDAMFINRELVLRGYGRATMPGIEPTNVLVGTYLGQLDPIGPIRAPEHPPRVIVAPARSIGSGTSRRPRASPTRAGGATRTTSGRAGSSH